MARSFLTVLVLTLSPLVALGLAVFVLSRNWRAWANRWLAVGLATMGAHQALLAGAMVARSPAWRLLLVRLALALAALIPPSWLAFSLTYRGHNGWSRLHPWRLVVALLTVAAPLTWAELALGYVVLPYRLPGGVLLFGLDTWGKVYFSIYLIGLVAVLLHFESLFRFAGKEARWQIKFLVVGVFVAFGCQIVALSYALLYRVLHPLHPILGGLAFLIGEGLIAFSLVRHRLLDVDIFVSRYVIYRSLTLALIGGYLIALSLIAEVFQRLDIPLDLLSGSVLGILGGAALALLLFSERVRRKSMSVIHAHFYRHKYDYRREWMVYTRQLSQAITVPEIATQTVDRILEVMWIQQAAMYVAGDQPGLMTLAYQVGYPKLPSTVDLPPAISGPLREETRDIPSRESAEERPEVARLVQAAFREVPVGCVVPVAGRDALVGLLVIGPETSGQPFGVDDRDLLAAVAAQAGALLVNARLSQKAMEGREFQALAKVAAFVVHDLKNTVATLAMLAENAELHIAKPEFQADALRTLREAISRMQALMATLASPFSRQADELRPLALDASVEAWMREIAGHIPTRIHVETHLASDVTVQAHPEHLRAVLHNLVLNAVEATPGEGFLRIETAQADGVVLLTVADTGCGMSREFLQGKLFRPFQTTKSRGLGIGLYQCRHILQSLGGTLSAESEEGKGTRMIAQLPVFLSSDCGSQKPTEPCRSANSAALVVGRNAP